MRQWVEERVNGYMHESPLQNGWLGVWMDGWMDGWMLNGWMDSYYWGIKQTKYLSIRKFAMMKGKMEGKTVNGWTDGQK